MEEMIKDYLSNVPIDLMCLKYNLKANTIRLKLNKLNIYRKKVHKSNSIYNTIYNYEDSIIEDFNSGISINKISKKYNLYNKRVSKILKEKGFNITNTKKNTIYNINKEYFNSIDTPEKAYIMGLLYADGWHSTEKNMVGLQLQEEDVDILKKINLLISSNKPLLYIKSKILNRKNTCRLVITNKRISSQLNKLGLIKNKTKTLVFPDWLSIDLYRHFIRGYFDGDGCICNSKNRKCFSLVGNKDFLLKIQDIFKNNLLINPNKLGKRYKKGFTYNISYSKKLDITNIFNYLYEDSTIHLNRKYVKFK